MYYVFTPHRYEGMFQSYEQAKQYVKQHMIADAWIEWD